MPKDASKSQLKSKRSSLNSSVIKSNRGVKAEKARYEILYEQGIKNLE